MTKGKALFWGALLSIFLALATVKTKNECQVLFSVLLGVALSVFAAFLVIEPIQRIAEENRWKKSKEIIIPTLLSELSNLTQEIQIHLNNHTSGALLGSGDVIAILDDISKRVREVLIYSTAALKRAAAC